MIVRVVGSDSSIVNRDDIHKMATIDQVTSLFCGRAKSQLSHKQPPESLVPTLKYQKIPQSSLYNPYILTTVFKNVHNNNLRERRCWLIKRCEKVIL